MEKHFKNVHDIQDKEYTIPPPWNPPPTSFLFTKLGNSKANLQKEDFRRIAQESIDTKIPANAVSYYTYGSVNQEHGRSGAAFHTQDKSLLWRLTNDYSTLQTELVAIFKALKYAEAEHGKPIIIHTD